MSTPESNTQPVQPSAPEDLMANALAAAAAKAAVRAERQAHFASVQPAPTTCIVAWVDLLGFREQIYKADTPAAFQSAYRRLRDVQEEFNKETASIDPDQGDLNANSGIRVFALSDGLVITLDLQTDCPAAEVSSSYDRVGLFLESLRLAQARCAAVGNLVRGGVAVGYFWFQNDILLSPALAQAYHMECKVAKAPVIVLHREFANKLRSMKADEGYRDDIDPMRDLFRDCEWMNQTERSQYVMLDFMPMFLDNDDPARYLKNYIGHLIDWKQDAPERAHIKYDWLIQYAKEFYINQSAQRVK